MNRKLVKIAVWSVSSVLAYGISASISTVYILNKKDEDIEEYITNNLEETIQAQEKKLNIHYPKERPKMYFTVPRGTSIETLAFYDPKDNTLHFRSGILTKPETDWSDKLAILLTMGSTHSAKRVLDHELAHVYLDNISEEAGLGSWPIDSGRFEHLSYLERIGLKMISEGTAVYFDNTMNGEDQGFEEEWPKKKSDFSGHVIYYGGYALVKPIISLHREKGIKYLMFNTPKEKEMFDLTSYQQRILKELSEK